jgi:hypothetical protein
MRFVQLQGVEVEAGFLRRLVSEEEQGAGGQGLVTEGWKLEDID